MKDIKRIRKELDVPQRRVAEHLKIEQYAYSRIENTKCDDKMYNDILYFLMSECNTLNMSKKRLADCLGVHKSNLYKYKGSLDHVLDQERERRIELKKELYSMLKKC